MKAIRPLTAILALLATASAALAAQSELHLIPVPKQIKLSDGAIELKPAARIIATTPALEPLARVLESDLLKLTGLHLTVEVASAGEAKPQAGDIVLKLDSSLPSGEACHWPHTVTVTDHVEITGSDYNAASMGTATLLQLLDAGAAGVRVPKLSISDCSVASYPGMMLDVARQNNTLQDVRNCIDLCHLYKVRFLHLHLNDMESVMFPSKLYPKLGTHNHSAHGGPKCEAWDRDDLLATIKYGDDRGVAIVPELETVFHTGAMMQDMPEEFNGPGVLNMGSEKMYQSLEPLIEEMCDVFKSSPYFQIGCDEASIGGVLEQPGTKDYMRQHDIHSGEDLYRYHIDRLAKVIARKGKRTIVWQDCPLPRDNKNIICMVWHMDFNHGDTAAIMQHGYSTIQVTWTPSCGSPVKDLYSWRPFDEQITPGKLAMGSQLVLWEQNGSVAIPFLRQKMPARQQFTYNPACSATYEQFAADLARTDALLDPLISGIEVTEKGLTQNVPQWLASGGAGTMPEFTFDKNLELTFKSNLPGAKVCYTVTPIATFNPTLLYGKEPTAGTADSQSAAPSGSPKPPVGQSSQIAERTMQTVDKPATSGVATGPITIAPTAGEAVCVEARLFDGAGKPLGGTWSRVYRWQPFVVHVKGTVADGDDRFGKEVEIDVQGHAPEGSIRYSIAGQVNSSSPVVDRPITLDKSGEVTIAFIDAAGQPRGLVWKRNFRKVDFDPTNVTYKKPVILWGNSTKQAAEVCVDGIVDHDQYLDIQPAPQQFGVDLLGPKTLNKVVLYTYWDGGRYYQYKIDLSSDAKQWTTVVDASKNHATATEHGYEHTFPPTEARYIRVTMLRNSANPGLHIIELRAFEAK